MKLLSETPSTLKPAIAWWSGGVASAVTCYLMLKWFGSPNVRLVFIDTKNEDEDTYRFKKDCELWWNTQIETITSNDYDSIEDVWEKFETLNTATGAICSSELKREVRQAFQKRNEFCFQSHGYDVTEIDRAKMMAKNYSSSRPVFPLIYSLMSKEDCFKVLEKYKIEPPRTYRLGFRNNNCFQTGCVQGGIGYWQKMRDEFPDKFEAMAAREHRLTNAKGKPVTILKDQSKKTPGLVFLKPHPSYPNMKDLSMMKGKAVEALIECNGFCNLQNKVVQLSEREVK